MRPKKKQEQKSASGHGGPRANSGGRRAGAGRSRNLQKTCQILMIAVQLVVSESTARRMLSEWRGSLRHLLSAEAAKILGEEWREIPNDEQMQIYEILRDKVEKNREEGWTTRL